MNVDSCALKIPQGAGGCMPDNTQFHEGQTVWVRSLGEILATLDADGKADGMPFMPEMTRYCSQAFRVSCLPKKTCIEGVGFRDPSGFVFLENLRCDGSAHDDCQRECVLFWSPAWLSDQPPVATNSQQASGAANLPTMKHQRYFCQSTELAGATSVYHERKTSASGKLDGYLADVRSGKMGIVEFLHKVVMAMLYRLGPMVGIDTSGEVYGSNQKTESLSLDLQPGDWVEVKSRKEIEATLDTAGKNRGLLFDPPMLDYCGKRYRVAKRLDKIILEETGRMISLKNTVILEDVICRAWACPRGNLHYWREIWLKRIDAPTHDG